MNLKPIAITQGDPSGIGPEIIAKAFRDAPGVTQGCFVVGDVAVMRQAFRFINSDSMGLPVAVIEGAADAMNVPPRCMAVLQAEAALGPFPTGEVSALAGRAAAQSIVWASKAALRGEIAAMVTAPIHKEALALAGAPFSSFPGHTEMLQAQGAEHLGQPIESVPVRMMLANDELRVVLVSIHLSLLQAIQAVSPDNVLQTLRIAHASLTQMLGGAPRIGVAGLNPHAGEGGLFGREEIEAIAPAIKAAQREGIDAHGPYAPDTVFMRARSSPTHPGEFDVVVAMYHDQGLIPVKYLGVEKGVNVTLGLPFVRTSPDHGTAFDIAGTGRADASSLIEAIRVAKQIARYS